MKNLVNVAIFCCSSDKSFFKREKENEERRNKEGEFSWAGVDLRHVTNRSRSFIYVDLFATTWQHHDGKLIFNLEIPRPPVSHRRQIENPSTIESYNLSSRVLITPFLQFSPTSYRMKWEKRKKKKEKRLVTFPFLSRFSLFQPSFELLH